MALCVLIDMFGFVRSYCVCVCAQVGLYELWVQCKPCCCSAAWRNTVVCSKGIIVEEFAVIGLWEHIGLLRTGIVPARVQSRKESHKGNSRLTSPLSPTTMMA